MRPTTGGVLVRETGGVGLLIEGLSQDEKKSSLESLEGVAEPSASAAMSVITTSSGYLENVSATLGTVAWQSVAEETWLLTRERPGKRVS